MLKLILGLTTVATLTASPTAFAQKKTMDQYWAETSISRQMLEAEWLVNNRNCAMSEARFRGCFQALNGIASRATPTLEVVPAALASAEGFDTGRTVLQLPGGLVLNETVARAVQGESLRMSQMRAVERMNKIRSALGDLYNSRAPGDLYDYTSALDQVMGYAKLPAAIEPAAVAKAIDNFMIEALDSHAHLNPMQQVQDDRQNGNTDIVGIGVRVQEVSGTVVVTQTIEGGPARESGMKANDVIIAINGESVAGMDISAVTDRIKGAENTLVVVRVQRKEQVVEIPITRRRIVFENVQVKVQELMGQKMLTVKLGTFTDGSACNKIEATMMALSQKNPDLSGVILDLRDNGGGLVDQALCIGGLFVGRQVIMKTKDLGRDGFDDLRSYRNQITKLPMVTLINGGSASASEVVSGALQDYQRSWVVGERSFGKATVQAPSMFAEGILIYRTVQRFYQPSGRTNQIVGILPDFETPNKPGATDDERFVMREGDLFPNALSAIGAPWEQPRPDVVAKIAECRARGRAENVYRLGDEVDYQLQVAAEVLTCE
ncbi:MAG: PDZ domain-containing protein [Bdellovibrionaceae bacterium]|nr:PDZ domain-containing protein [Pseudobdellovibrionaceae bacterium]